MTDPQAQRQIAELERQIADLAARLDRVPVRFATGAAGGGSGTLPPPQRQYDIIISNDGTNWHAGVMRLQGLDNFF